MSQSAISQGIKNLELALNCELLNHKKSKFHLTHKGEKVLREAKSILQSLYFLQRKVEAEDEIVGDVSIGITNSLALVYLSKIYAKTQELLPSLKIHVNFGNSEQLKFWIETKKIDFAILMNDSDISDFDFRKIG